MLTHLINVEDDRANATVVRNGAGFEGGFRGQVVFLGVSLPVEFLGQFH
jgi:hypothetical protein